MGRFDGYHAGSFRKDIISGLIVGIIAIPLGMAFAIAAGVKPEYGIYTTIIAGFLISLFGGSKFQIGGPTGAFIPILLAIVIQYGYENLLIAGFLAGIILVLMGVFKLGALIKFIPRPVTIGFTTGIAVIIFSGQISNFLGLRDIENHEDFLPNMKEIIMHITTINFYSVITAGICFMCMLLTPRYLPKVPGSLVGLLASSLTAALFFRGDIATIASSFGAIPSTLPRFHFPEITLERIETLIRPAFIIAILGGIESLLSAKVADGMTGNRHNSNRELIGQGIANMVSPLFGGIPATGAIARTATNIKSGAVSPMSGILHSAVVLLVLILFAPYASDIPLASMAPILMLVAWNMSERKEFVHILNNKTSDSLVLLVTCLLTVFTNLTTAVEVGLIMAVILFVKRMSEALTVIEELDYPTINIYSIEGPLFFGTANGLEKSTINQFYVKSNIILLHMEKVTYMDTTGEFTLARIVQRFENLGSTVLISGIQRQPLEVLKKMGLYKLVGSDHFFEQKLTAIEYALRQSESNQCLEIKYS